jgi:hypothetical protein
MSPIFSSGKLFLNSTSVGSIGVSTESPTTDPYFSNVTALFHFDNSWVDSSPSNITLQRFANPQLNTTTVKHGSGSLYTNGGITYWTMPSAIVTNDLAMECWLNPVSSISGNDCIVFATGYSDANVLWIQRDETSNIPMRLVVAVGDLGSLSNKTIVVSGGPGTEIPDGVWSHLAVTKTNGVYKLFVNGIDSNTGSSNSTPLGGTSAHIGRNAGGGQILYAYIDDFRLTVGTSRYTSNFTPPSAPFPDQ